MSHHKERKEKICLNCNAELHGRFCHVCGQENLEPKESFGHLVRHFFEDITHFDGKFFITVKDLLFKPGFLSKEYVKGKRASYLHPVRMYFFTSFVFFLIYFGFYKSDLLKINPKGIITASQKIKQLEKEKKVLNQSLKEDSLPALAQTIINTKVQKIDSVIRLLQKDSTAIDKIQAEENEFTGTVVSLNDDKNYRSENEYDSIQKTLAENKRDGYFTSIVERKNIEIKKKYKTKEEILNHLSENFKHRIPQLMFVVLPLFALLLQLLYSKQRKKFYYVSHAIYSIHLYTAVFVMLLIAMLLGSAIHTIFHIKTEWFSGIAFIVILLYWYKSARNFYEQSRLKTILKLVILSFLSLILMLILFIGLFVFSAFTL